MSNEVDFFKALSRDSCDINGVYYRQFAWTLDFDEESDPPCVPVWIFFPGRPPNLYHTSVLESLTALIGRLIHRDNPTRYATRTDGARVCVEIDASKEPLPYFWIGKPGLPSSRKQVIIYETLPTYCKSCRRQGHNLKTCRVGNENKAKKFHGGPVWVKKLEKLEVNVPIDGELQMVEHVASQIKGNEGQAMLQEGDGRDGGIDLSNTVIEATLESQVPPNDVGPVKTVWAENQVSHVEDVVAVQLVEEDRCNVHQKDTSEFHRNR
ncbi:uncharacterized protein LOC122276861 [Carya illinoinensis]|uniref:uncharacterized protein LOC122276861 n=1 Tax=Carya illinoinensis TaxID=32201 RepID=UPI001C72711A|nr:uncharacterized protein LOC122276861 [Carya illinoinensis]